MDRWNTSFLLAWPIFRGEPLVLGSVPYKSCLQNVTALLGLMMSHCILNLKLALTKFPDLQWVLPFGYSCLAPILVVLKWTLAFFWVYLSGILHMNRWVHQSGPCRMGATESHREMLEFFGSLDTTMISLYMVSCLADVFLFFRGTRAGRQQKHGGKGGRPFEEGKGWKQDSWISWGWKMAPSNSYTIDTFQHLERGALHGSFTGCQFTIPLGLIGAPLKVLVEECIQLFFGWEWWEKHVDRLDDFG